MEEYIVHGLFARLSTADAKQTSSYTTGHGQQNKRDQHARQSWNQLK